MTPSRMLRPVLISLTALAAASCSAVESDPNRFEGMARHVADLRLDGSARGEARAPVHTAAESGLRPARPDAGSDSKPAPLQVQIMDPHDLWDARDGRADGMRAAISRAAIETARHEYERVAPVEQPRPAPQGMRAAVHVAPHETVGLTTLQLGAFSSEAGARNAWARISGGPAGNALSGLSPVYQAVEVKGRSLTRLTVRAAPDSAAAICRAAEITDPWCARRT